MNYPLLEINLSKITKNAAALVKLCSKHNIQVSAVVKTMCGSPEVARALLACEGIKQLGDSRIANIERLHRNGVSSEFIMLRIPMLSQCPKIVRLCDYSLNSEMPVIAALGREAAKINRTHKVILMIDVGDLREGVLPEDAPCIAEQITELAEVILAGVGTNLSCYGGVRPTEKNMAILVACAEQIEKRIGRKLDIISGGNSSSLPLLIAGKMPKRINHLRIGEGILLGRDTLECKVLPGTSQDAFLFKSEIIEAGRKPSAPIGEIVRDAFGNCPEFENRGIRRRAILGAGRQDIVPEALSPLEKNAKILGASSDHLLVDIEDCRKPINTGNTMSFSLQYSALLNAMTSSYVHKIFINDIAENSQKTDLQIIFAPTSMGANMSGTELAPEILNHCGLTEQIGYLRIKQGRPVDSLAKKFIFEKNCPLDKKLEQVKIINKKIAYAVRKALDLNKFPVLIGGDHTVTIAAVTELSRHCRKSSMTGLIMFGAFANFNSAKTSKSGNLHGLTLDACTNAQSPLHIKDSKVIPQENVALIGVRDLDIKERERLKNSKINVFTMEKIDYLGISEVTNQVLSKLRHCHNGIHISISMDALSPEYAPGVSLPVEAGLNIREIYMTLEMIHASGLYSSMDIVEYNPKYDKQNITAKLAMNLVCTLFGKKII